MVPGEAHDHAEDTEEAPRGALTRHISKRARRNKSLVVVFDPAARREYVTGFQKRKKKRRKIAEQQKLKKDREKRLAERKQRRQALKLAIGETEENEDDQENGKSDGSEDEQHQNQPEDTVVYEDEEMMTIVNTCNIDMNGDLNSDHSQKKVGDAISYRKAQIKKKSSSQKKLIGKSKRRK